jgi:hypothetical protein
MATSVTQSLFGITPQSIQNERDAALQQQALQFAKLDPFQSARMGLFQGAAQLGSGIVGAMGDPEIEQARQRQGMLGGLDVSDPAALRQAAQNADPQTASLLVSRAMELEQGSADIGAAQALAAQRNREADPIQEFAKTGKYTPQSLAAFAKSRNVADLVLVENLSQPEIAKLQAYRDTLTDPRKIAEVDAVIKAAAEGRGTKVDVTVSPTIKQGSSVTDLMNNIDKLTKPDQEMLRSAETTKKLINEAAASNNSQAWEAARTQVAKAIGEGKLSNEDIRRTGIDPRVVQGALDWVNKKIEGVPNKDIMEQLYTVASLLERTSVERINNKMGKARTIGTKEGGLSKETAETLFPSVGGGKKATNWADMPN